MQVKQLEIKYQANDPRYKFTFGRGMPTGGGSYDPHKRSTPDEWVYPKNAKPLKPYYYSLIGVQLKP